jgi:hypothetical protein
VVAKVSARPLGVDHLSDSLKVRHEPLELLLGSLVKVDRLLSVTNERIVSMTE